MHTEKKIKSVYLWLYLTCVIKGSKLVEGKICVVWSMLVLFNFIFVVLYKIKHSTSALFETVLSLFYRHKRIHGFILSRIYRAVAKNLISSFSFVFLCFPSSSLSVMIWRGRDSLDIERTSWLSKSRNKVTLLTSEHAWCTSISK